MDVIRVVISSVIAGLCAVVVVLNWVYAFMDRAQRKKAVPRHVSTVPVVSVVLSLMYVIFSLSVYKQWIWALPLLDIGNWHLVAAACRRR
jgi:hypothetical protein